MVGVSDNGNAAAGNFDGSGYSYSAQSLAAAGVTPGGTVKVGTTTATFPPQAPGIPDAVNAGRSPEANSVGAPYVDGATRPAARASARTWSTKGLSAHAAPRPAALPRRLPSPAARA